MTSSRRAISSAQAHSRPSVSARPSHPPHPARPGPCLSARSRQIRDIRSSSSKTLPCSMAGRRTPAKPYSNLRANSPSRWAKIFRLHQSHGAFVCYEPGRFVLKSRLQRITLPAAPLINGKRLETSCLGLAGSGPVPYALLTGVMAHATHYVPEIRHLHTELWAKALLALDDEYRLPRLGTLQLALLVFFSRPMLKGENAGQITIALARVSCAVVRLYGSDHG